MNASLVREHVGLLIFFFGFKLSVFRKSEKKNDVSSVMR